MKKQIKLSIAVFGLLLGLGMANGTAFATSSAGTHWTGTYLCSGIGAVAGEYNNQNVFLTRAYGYSVASYGNTKVKKVEVWEYKAGVQKGYRIVNYAGTSTTAVMENIPTTYLPNMVNAADGTMRVKMTNTAGGVCNVLFNIGR